MSVLSFLSGSPLARAHRAHGVPSLPALSLSAHAATLSRGEVSHLWSFAQASIMLPEVRTSLRRSWGLCARHAAGWLIVEAAFRRDYLHGPAVLYDDLMEIAVALFDVHGPLARERAARRLRAHGPCLLCEMGVTPQSTGFITEERWRCGRDATAWRASMARTRDLWRALVCGVCDGSGAPVRCRTHLCDDIAVGCVDSLAPHAALVRDIARHVRQYDRSFRWECHGSDTPHDHAALIGAIGWCSGWQVLLALDAAAGSAAGVR
jgi:hypothetical protein